MPRPHSMKTVATGGFFLCVFFNKTPQFFFSFFFFLPPTCRAFPRVLMH